MPPLTGPPMNLANMRSLGVTRVMAYCACRHEASIDVSAMPDDVFRRGRGRLQRQTDEGMSLL
jgi:hypothetical protein